MSASNDTVELPLTRGFSAIIDKSSWDLVQGYTWRAVSRRSTVYAYGKKGGREIKLHRIILSAPDGMEVDHINGDGLDNRLENLRLVTTAQNAWNRAKRRTPASSIFKGVSWSRRKLRWHAVIYANNKAIWLGAHKSEIDAAQAYNAAAKEFHGEFARLNDLSALRAVGAQQ